MKNGFTIIELVISIFILSIAVVGIFSAFSIMVILTSDAADRLTATYLAQEGMEIVMNIRDTDWLYMDAGVPGATWVDGLTSDSVNQSIDCTRGCEADYTSTAMEHLDGAYLNLKNGFYAYDTNNLSMTKFQRKIIIDNTLAPYILKITVKASWNQKATILNPGESAVNCTPNNCITTESTLYDWYNYTASQPSQ